LNDKQLNPSFYLTAQLHQAMAADRAVQYRQAFRAPFAEETQWRGRLVMR